MHDLGPCLGPVRFPFALRRWLGSSLAHTGATAIALDICLRIAGAYLGHSVQLMDWLQDVPFRISEWLQAHGHDIAALWFWRCWDHGLGLHVLLGVLALVVSLLGAIVSARFTTYELLPVEGGYMLRVATGVWTQYERRFIFTPYNMASLAVVRTLWSKYWGFGTVNFALSTMAGGGMEHYSLPCARLGNYGMLRPPPPAPVPAPALAVSKEPVLLAAPSPRQQSRRPRRLPRPPQDDQGRPWRGRTPPSGDN